MIDNTGAVALNARCNEGEVRCPRRLFMHLSLLRWLSSRSPPSTDSQGVRSYRGPENRYCLSSQCSRSSCSRSRGTISGISERRIPPKAAPSRRYSGRRPISIAEILMINGVSTPADRSRPAREHSLSYRLLTFNFVCFFLFILGKRIMRIPCFSEASARSTSTSSGRRMVREKEPQ